MAMGSGFSAPEAAAPRQNTGNPLHNASGIFHMSNKQVQNRRSELLLDYTPQWGYRHKSKRPYIQGQVSDDWREREVRLTCAVAMDAQDHPRECLVCEAALRKGDILKRHFTSNLS